MKKLLIVLCLLFSTAFCFADKCIYKIKIGDSINCQGFTDSDIEVEFILSEIEPIDNVYYKIHITAIVRNDFNNYTIPCVYTVKVNEVLNIYLFRNINSFFTVVREIGNNYIVLSN